MCPNNPGLYLVVAYSLADAFVNLELSREVLATFRGPETSAMVTKVTR